jgi:hypothetical protein
MSIDTEPLMSDPKAVYLGFKGGSPAHNHGHMDAGAFVLEADGVRWAVDLGAEDYRKIEELKMNLWSMKQDADRWNIFRLNNRSHNTLTIDGRLQHAAGFAPITAFTEDQHGAHAVMDLTAVYAGQVSRAVRAAALLPSREVLIQDRLEGLASGAKVRWGMVTRAKLTAVADAMATLSQTGKTLVMRGYSAEPVNWKTFDTETPPNTWDAPNKGTVMVGFEMVAPASGTLDMRVLFTAGTTVAQSIADSGSRLPNLLK